ncbi:MAG TPA: MmgE/PrpD family protein [Acetobacteraceae bacterium]|nr:MmgE/PrpD family protein [Acetobacteraceae bacterium]
MTHAIAAPGPTRELAEFVAALGFDQLPAEVVAKAKTCILDTIGCCLFGASLPPVRMVAAMAAEEGGVGPAGVFGLPLSTSASQAALVNATAAHSFQLDEIHLEATLHPGSVALPAAFAMSAGMASGAGRALITAMVAGYEVGLRIGVAAKGPMFARGFHNQGTTGVFVAAAAAASMLRLDPGQARHALGIAGSQAAGLMAVQEGAMTKGFHSGRAAQSGVYAAELAQRGYTGIPDVLEARPGGFLSAFAGIQPEPQLTAGLGSRWETLRVGYKPAPASNGSITAMTAMDRIMREHGLSVDDVQDVTAFVSTNTLHHCGWEYDPNRIQGVLSAQMNLRYGIAVMALEREAGVDQFHAARLRDPRILAFIGRVRVQVEPAFDDAEGKFRVACRLVVRCLNGAQHQAEVLYRKGSPEDPMSADELDAKFMSLASKSVDEQAARRIAEMVLGIDRIDCLEELSRLVTPRIA